MLKTTARLNRVLELVLRDFASLHSISAIASYLGCNRMGAWRIMEQLSNQEYVIKKTISSGRTTAHYFALNLNNKVADKHIALLLVEQASHYERWADVFDKLKDYTKFLVLYGSIMTTPKQANDIDIICIVKDKKYFKDIDKCILKIQNTEAKKIHAIIFTEEEFKQELIKQNRAFISAVKEGIILYGHEQFIDFMKDMHRVKI